MFAMITEVTMNPKGGNPLKKGEHCLEKELMRDKKLSGRGCSKLEKGGNINS